MSIERGTRLGPYEVVSRIGAGGMGEVWRGRDTRLERAVAIKILPAEFANDAKFKIRFEREAKAISQLNHPNICTLYDVGENYLVMELLEGESLADRVARGQLPLHDVLKYGVQIAEALGKAHREGIIHRDLKPANIMLTRSGAKLLDFGLARREVVAAESTTLQKPVTEEGTIVGTVQYMAPEQLDGHDSDTRTDIFALGAVLYEMATGKRAFQGSTRTSIITAIATGDPPPLSRLQPLAPPALEHVIEKCLAKDPDARWQSAYDIAEELRWTGEIGSTSGAIAAPQMQRAAKRWRLATISLLALAAVATTGVMTWRRAHSDRPAVMRFTLPVAASPAEYGGVALAPNGHELVYARADGEVQRLYRRTIDQSESSPIEGTEGGWEPFFSPDGKWIGFFAHHKLMKVAASGGQPVAICAAAQPRGATWGDDDTIIFCPFLYSGLQRVSAAGGKPQKLTTVDPKQGERSHRYPHLLPESKVVLFSTGYGGSWDDAKIVAQRLDTGERKVIVNGGCDGRYLPTGHLVYLRGTSLYAVGFDPKRLVTRGQPIEIVKAVSNNFAGSGEFAVAENGLLVYHSPGATRDEGGLPLIVNRRGDPQPISTVPMESIGRPRFSPEGTKIVGRKGVEIWVFDLQRGTSSRLTTGMRTHSPIWSPDGKRVAYASERNGSWNLYWRAADGSDQEQLIARSDVSSVPTDFSSDGKQLLVGSISERTGFDVVTLSLSDRRIRPVEQSENEEGDGVFSPDGRWIAYVSDESGRQEVYVHRFSGEGGKYQISTDGGTRPAWRRNEIFYRCGSKMMAVTVRTEPEFAADTPRVLFETTFSDFDVTRDGQRFVIIQQKEKSAGGDHLNVVVNWFDDLRARMGAER